MRPLSPSGMSNAQFHRPARGCGFLRASIWVFENPNELSWGWNSAGEIKSVGTDVTRFKPGDQVFASTFAVNFGGYAEYKCLPEDEDRGDQTVQMTFEEAAAVPGGGMTALRCLEREYPARTKRVIYGASGAVGTYAVQLAKHFGADVTGVCSTANLDLVKSLGADQVIDYTQEDFTQRGETYDVIFDAVASFHLHG